MSLRSSLGLTQEATASQKKMKSWQREGQRGFVDGLRRPTDRPTNRLAAPKRLSPYLHDTCGVHADHHADSPEGRVLLLIVSDVSQRRAPVRGNDEERRPSLQFLGGVISHLLGGDGADSIGRRRHGRKCASVFIFVK